MIRAIKTITFVISGAFLFFSFAFSANEPEQLTITTYYPSPYGSYNELQLYPHDTAVTTCNQASKGTMYYYQDPSGDSAKDEVRVCSGDAAAGYGWEGISKFGSSGAGNEKTHNRSAAGSGISVGSGGGTANGFVGNVACPDGYAMTGIYLGMNGMRGLVPNLVISATCNKLVSR